MFTWTAFLIIISWQLFIFLVLAWKKTCTPQVTFTILWKSLLVGLPFGVVFDLAVGEYAGVYDYQGIGFTFPFLAINGIFSYGLMIATAVLLYSNSFFQMYTYSIVLAVLYESVNYFSPVWHWTFNDSFVIELFVLVFAAYFGLMFLMGVTMMPFTKKSFAFLSTRQ